MIQLMSAEFRDNTRYPESTNAVAATWLVSFEQIRNYAGIAANLLAFISCIEPKAIPRSLLPVQDGDDIETAIGTLCGYALLVSRDDGEIFDMHRLVNMATRVWTRKYGLVEQTVSHATRHLTEIFPSNTHETSDLWREYLPHALRLLFGHRFQAEDRYDLLMNTGKCLDHDRRFPEAIMCFEEACAWKRDSLAGDDDLSCHRLWARIVAFGDALSQ
jgi:hypothetical protein